MAISPGTRLGPYEITDALGAGGMGEVYRARDTRLDRTVAIKVLAGHMGKNEELRQRFDREARTISSLSHPRICQLYDVGHEGETDYLVMEYLEGETLADRLGRDRLPPEEVLTIGLEITEALTAAHRAGVVHRDLKPGNVMLTKNGVKLLDFGLAKMAANPADAVQSGITAMPTEQQGTQPLTERGTILGTFQYMAPEQLEGQEADARSDIFALGGVLYEMATGRKAFEGKSQASLIAAILERTPTAISAVEPMSPPALDHLVTTCLAKEPDDRMQTAHDVHLQLKWIQEGGSRTGVPAPVAAGRRRSNRLAWTLAIVFAAATLVVGGAFLLREKPVPEHVEAEILAPEGTSFTLFGIGMIALSPDGAHLAFVAEEGEERMLWIRPLGSLRAQPLRGTESALFPFWSPDSRFVCFFARDKLKRIDVRGGAPVTVCAAPQGRGGSWGVDDTIVLAPLREGPLHRVPASGGESVAVTALDTVQNEVGHRWPWFLPDGRHFIYTAQRSDASDDRVMVAALDGSVNKKIVDVSSSAAYAGGHLLYVRGEVLMAQPFDTKRLEVTGDGFVAAEPVLNHGGWSLSVFTVSQSGHLAYLPEADTRGERLLWYDRAGLEIDAVDEPASVQDVEMSRDGRLLAFARDAEDGSGIDVWTYDVERKLHSRLTFDGDADDPAFSPDGQRIAYAESGNLYVKNASGAGEATLLYENNVDKVTHDWSSDGGTIIFSEVAGNTQEDLWILPLDGEPRPLLKTNFREMHGKLSPDGRWIAYTSDESGDLQVYVQDFPALGGKWQISRESGSMPRWRGDGREIVFMDDAEVLHAASIESDGTSLRVGQIEQLFASKMNVPHGIRTHYWAMTSDAQQFVVTVAPLLEEGQASTLRLVLDWAHQTE